MYNSTLQANKPKKKISLEQQKSITAANSLLHNNYLKDIDLLMEVFNSSIHNIASQHKKTPEAVCRQFGAQGDETKASRKPQAYNGWCKHKVEFLNANPGLHLLLEGAKSWNAINVKKPFASKWQSMPADEQEMFRQYATQTQAEKVLVLHKVGKAATVDASATL
ncbi:hypothetical protein FRB94_012945 [Tulasnella sp. JGI-2019a]|nr:hypothetical protein FRB94_012945 [Tulasnella sp. JGI-2019a]